VSFRRLTQFRFSTLEILPTFQVVGGIEFERRGGVD